MAATWKPEAGSGPAPHSSGAEARPGSAAQRSAGAEGSRKRPGWHGQGRADQPPREATAGSSVGGGSPGIRPSHPLKPRLWANSPSPPLPALPDAAEEAASPPRPTARSAAAARVAAHAHSNSPLLRPPKAAGKPLPGTAAPRRAGSCSPWPSRTARWDAGAGLRRGAVAREEEVARAGTRPAPAPCGCAASCGWECPAEPRELWLSPHLCATGSRAGGRVRWRRLTAASAVAADPGGR